MAVNKVVYGTTVLVDLTEDTVTVDKLAKGITAHDKTGAKITGTLESGGGTGDWHIWERCNIAMISDTYDLTWGESSSESMNNVSTWMDSYKRIIYKTLTVDNTTGKIVLSDPLSTTQSTTANQYSNWQTYPYYYGDKNNGATDDTVYKITNFTRSGSIISYSYVREFDKAVLTAADPHPGKGEIIENVASLESTTYPDSGQQGEYWYEKV